MCRRSGLGALPVRNLRAADTGSGLGSMQHVAAGCVAAPSIPPKPSFWPGAYLSASGLRLRSRAEIASKWPQTNKKTRTAVGGAVLAQPQLDRAEWCKVWCTEHPKHP
ncbi:hypothetical protein NDU88_005062 [Pleurodeles waltl]|uniref:Uncharacterized protein n=1 Tax=Pleurodeles waltl TaxID=8319 RepID=A0AAV7QDN2_PLEWA|nr:hypothetical protein NDU88_005062 [Pleurodeles waltl]